MLRLRLFLFLCACFCLNSELLAGRVFEDTLAQRTLACTACHGEQGRAGPDGYYPRLAGKPAGYLYNQLRNFRDGRRHTPAMTGLLLTLDETYLQTIAGYFSSLSLPYPPPKPSGAGSAELERGHNLVQDGDPGLGIPACTQCHGLKLTGVNPATPGLLGLPADYINAQLSRWRVGRRHAASPDCMATIARRLTSADSNALARWLSAQVVPANAHAADARPAASAKTIDMACGSVPDASNKAQVAPAAPAALSAQAERGSYLARIGNCSQCHTASGGQAYAGGRAIDTPFGAVYSSNITPDPVYGIGKWTADDFWHAMHEGLSKDGHALYPAFPYTSFTRVSRADADALFAYLQSLPTVALENQPHALRWPYSSSLALRAWRALFFSPAAEAPQAASATVQRGEYLVNGLGHCMECHSARNALGAMSQSPTAGGMVLPGSAWFAPSLADVAGASVANWDASEIMDFLTSGHNSKAVASGPMAEVVLYGTQYLNPADARAMALYLKALPQVAAQSSAVSTLPASMLQTGSKLYENQCADCHGLQGQGRAGAYPALAGNRVVTQHPANNLIRSVLGGGFAASTQSHPRPFGMPPFLLTLGDADVAAVLNYIRNTWGNQAAAISEFDINQFRHSQAP